MFDSLQKLVFHLLMFFNSHIKMARYKKPLETCKHCWQAMLVFPLASDQSQKSYRALSPTSPQSMDMCHNFHNAKSNSNFSPAFLARNWFTYWLLWSLRISSRPYCFRGFDIVSGQFSLIDEILKLQTQKVRIAWVKDFTRIFCSLKMSFLFKNSSLQNSLNLRTVLAEKILQEHSDFSFFWKLQYPPNVLESRFNYFFFLLLGKSVSFFPWENSLATPIKLFWYIVYSASIVNYASFTLNTDWRLESICFINLANGHFKTKRHFSNFCPQLLIWIKFNLSSDNSEVLYFCSE